MNIESIFKKKFKFEEIVSSLGMGILHDKLALSLSLRNNIFSP
jgi:hypothetical protein